MTRVTDSHPSLLRVAGMLAAIPIVVAGARLVQDAARFGPARAHLYGGLMLLGGAALFGALARRWACPAAALDIPATPYRPLTRLDRWMFP